MSEGRQNFGKQRKESAANPHQNLSSSKGSSGQYQNRNSDPNHADRQMQGGQKTITSAPTDTKESKSVAPAPVGSTVWGKAPSEAIRTAPPTPRLVASNTVPPSQSRPNTTQTANHGGANNRSQHRDKEESDKSHKDKRNDQHRHHYQHRRSSAGEGADGDSHGTKKGQQTTDHRPHDKSSGPHAHKHGHYQSKNHHRSHHPNDQRSQFKAVENKNETEWERGKPVSDELCMPGEGVSSGQQVVQRIRVEDLLAIRLALLDLPPDVSIPNSCLWNSPTRKDELTLIHNTPRQLRDVSALVDKKKTKKESEPLPLEDDCKPLEINEDTRWKARVFDGNAENVTAQEHGENETDDSVLKKALLILNKLSLTKFDKLSDDFLACGIGRNEKCLRGATQLIVKKAQDEQHFSAMYASLCLKLAATPMALDEGDDAKKGKKFKKMLLEECQKEFEEDTTTKIEIATKDVTDKDEKRIVADLVKKHYLGHMRFIGELYKGDIISIKIMLHCLPALLENDRVIRGMEDIGSRSEIDEEKIECFTKLMATIGFSLEQQSEAMKSVKKVDASKKLEECWNRVAVLAGLTPGQCPNVSTRIKYLLQDLVELKNSGWIARRKEESAKTLAEIHQQVEEEARPLHMLKRQSSYGAFERPKPVVDADGFEEVPRAAFGRSRSMINVSSSIATPLNTTRRSDAIVKKLIGVDDKKPMEKKIVTDPDAKMVPQAPSVKNEPFTDPSVSNKPSHEYIMKTKAMFKDYFRSGDIEDVILSFQELLSGVENPASTGAKIIEISIMTVLEMKNEDVTKLLHFIKRCFQENKIDSACLLTALGHPLEVLQDISIDAPHAGRHLVTIVAEIITFGGLSFDFLLETPEFFRLEVGAARFGCDVLKKLGEGYVDSSASIEVIEKLMTDEDRQTYSSAKEMVSVL